MNKSKYALLVILAVTSMAIYAGDSHNHEGYSSKVLPSISTSTATGNQSVSFNSEKLSPPAIAPATSNGASDCNITTAESHAFSVFFASYSSTDGVSYNAICYAFKRQQYDIADKLMCTKDKNYAALNPICATTVADVDINTLSYEQLIQHRKNVEAAEKMQEIMK